MYASIIRNYTYFTNEFFTILHILQIQNLCYKVTTLTDMTVTLHRVRKIFSCISSKGFITFKVFKIKVVYVFEVYIVFA